jgi:hypothetical protein
MAVVVAVAAVQPVAADLLGAILVCTLFPAAHQFHMLEALTV